MTIQIIWLNKDSSNAEYLQRIIGFDKIGRIFVLSSF